MNILFDRTFKKQYDKADKKIQKAFEDKLHLFAKDTNSHQLRNHKLIGKHKGLRSINITGDWRALFIENKTNDDIIVTFVLLGTHSQLYK